MKRSNGIQLLAASCLMVAVSANANEAIAQKAGCLGCHAVDTRVVGKAYRDVAVKYRRNPFASMILRYKIRNGTGKNKPIPMPPHDKKKIGDSELTAVIDWILSLR